MSDFRNRYRSPLYKAIRFIAVSLIRVCLRLRVEGLENVPEKDGCIVASNHIHNFDPFLVGSALPRFVEFMAKEELFRVSVVAGVIRFLGAFPVRRGGNDKAAMKRALEVPKRDGCLVIFPEGHRSKDGRIGKGMPGVALIARRSACPVVPCAIVGTYGFGRKIIVRFGSPISPSEDDTNESLLDKLMTQIRMLHGNSNPELTQ